MRVHVCVLSVAVTRSDKVVWKHIGEAKENGLCGSGESRVFSEHVCGSEGLQLRGYVTNLSSSDDAGDAGPGVEIGKAFKGLSADKSKGLAFPPFGFDDDVFGKGGIGKDGITNATTKIVGLRS
jgi:hypothetical protein